MRWRTKFCQDEKALTLIEALVALVVLTVGILGATKLFGLVIRQGNLEQQKNVALALATEYMEQNKAICTDFVYGFGRDPSTGVYHLVYREGEEWLTAPASDMPVLSPAGPVTRDNMDYQVVFRVAYRAMDLNSSVKATTEDGVYDIYSNQLLQLTTVVYWPYNAAATDRREVQLTTLVRPR